MSVFVDTSALLALVNPDDRLHHAATTTFASLNDEEALVTTNYVVVESLALVQRRLGMATLSTLRHDILEALEVQWVDPPAHQTALDELEAQGHRHVSFVDHASFGFMRSSRMRTAFAFDDDFRDAGFEVVPSVAP